MCPILGVLRMKTLAGLVLFLLPGVAMAIEEPRYTVLESGEGFEIRQYEPYIVAEVTVDGSMRQSGNSAFRILAGYIFGDNRSKAKMNMTAPVESRAVGERMSMTVPVETVGNGGSYVYGFVMESRYTLDTLPDPIDPRIRIREVPARTMVVRGFTGRWTDGNYERHESALLEYVRDRDMELVGNPVFARYDGPMTPFFMRRNEVMVEITQPAAGSERR